MIYDVIGDIHGRAEKLKGLLETLSYQLKPFQGDALLGEHYYHPPEGHRALFIGDLIDRGNEEVATLQIVFAMIDAGVADAVMGNHEYNALAYATPNKLVEAASHTEFKMSGVEQPYLRSHNNAHRHQHEAFLNEVPFGSDAHHYWLTRFYELPLWIETDHACFVHACWDEGNMAVLAPLLTDNRCLTPHALQLTGQKDSPEYDALERVLKGVEVKLPAGISFTDKDGTVRTHMRVKWWLEGLSGIHLEGRRIIDIARAPKADLAQIPQEALMTPLDFRIKTDKPIFIGHYWLTGTPEPLSSQVVCTDYSAATTGYLTAYQLDTEHPLPLSTNNFVQFIPK